MDYKGKTALVTGASGFIGSNLCKKLLASGANVIGLARKSNARIAELQDSNFEFIECDIVDSEKLQSILSGKNIDFIFHLSAQPSKWFAKKNPAEDTKINVIGTINMLKLCVDKNSSFVYPSTIALYDGLKDGSYSEDEINPASFYAVSKNAAEEYCMMFNKMFGSKVSILRFSYVYGPGMDRGVVYDIFKQFLENKQEINLFMQTDNLLDFLYVDDAVEAMMNAATSPDSVGKVLNISTGKGVTVSGLLESISKLFDTPKFDVKVQDQDGRISLVLDNTKAAEILGWKPKHDIGSGLRLAYESLKK